MVVIGLILVGAITGLLSGLLGIGGGVILVPGLVLVLGVPIHTAMGISLLVIVPTALGGILKYYSTGTLEIGTAMIVAASAMLTSYLGASLAVHLPADVLRKIFGVFLILMGLQVYFDLTRKILGR